MGTPIVDLFARIGLKADNESVKRFSNELKFTKNMLKTVALAAGGTAATIAKLTNDAMKGAVALKQFEVETGASAQSLQKWQSVALQTNQSAESVTAAIKAITSNQEKIRLGEGSIGAYQLLGIDPNQDPFEILDQLRDKTDGLSQAMKRNVLSQMGIGADMIQTLELSRDEFDAMASRAFIISPQAIETLNRAKSAMDQAGRGFQWIKTQIAVALSPQIKKLSNQFIEFIKINEDGIVKAFKKAYRFVKIFADIVFKLVRLVFNLVTAIGRLNPALKVMLGLMAAISAAMFMSPLGLITAAIVLLYLVIQDLVVYARGEGRSVFGELAKKFPGFGKMLSGFVEIIRDIRDAFRGLRDQDMSGVQNLIEKWGILGDILAGIVVSLDFIKDGISGELSQRLLGKADKFRESGREGRADLIDFLNAPIGSERQSLTGRADRFRESGREGRADLIDFLNAPIGSERQKAAIPGFLKLGNGSNFSRREGGVVENNNSQTVNIYGAENEERLLRRLDDWWNEKMSGPSSRRAGENE